MRFSILVTGVALVLIGGYSLLGGGFSLAERETVLDLGPIQATAETRNEYRVPPVLAGIAVVVGLAAVAYGARKPS